MFSDWLKVNETSTYYVYLGQGGVTSDLSKLHLNIIAGDQVPIVLISRNFEVNNSLLAFDAEFESMIIAELTKESV